MFKLLKSNKKILLLSTILVLLMFGINYKIEFASDTYATFLDPDIAFKMIVNNGRIIIGLIYYIIQFLALTPNQCYYLSYFFAIVFSILALALYSALVNSILKSDYISLFLSFLIIFNPFCIEYFLFIEKGLFIFAIFISTLSVYFFIQFLVSKHARYLLFSVPLLLLVVFTYQIIIGLFCLQCIPFLLKYSKNLKSFLINNIFLYLLYAFPSIISFLFTKIIFHSSRIASNSVLSDLNLNHILNVLSIFRTDFYHIPAYYLLFIFMLLVLPFFILLYFHFEFLLIGSFFYSLLNCIIWGLFPTLIGITTSMECRVIYPFGCLFGIQLLSILFMYHYPSNAHFSNKFKAYLIFTLIICIISEYILFQNTFICRYQVNQTDKYICEIIGEKIRLYEEDTGTEITTICYYSDQNLTWGYDRIWQNGLSDRAYALGWSNLRILNYYLDKQYVKGEPNEQYSLYFSSQNWNTYSDEQLSFEGNTLHFCIY